MNQTRINGIRLDEGDGFNFNKVFNLTFFEDLPENMKNMVTKKGFLLDDKGFVITPEGVDVTYDELEELSNV